jgi:hypothetical protein
MLPFFGVLKFKRKFRRLKVKNHPGEEWVLYVNRNDSNKLDTNRTIKEIGIFVNKYIMFQGVLIL